jgi:lipopolysaccharide transport system permease protein
LVGGTAHEIAPRATRLPELGLRDLWSYRDLAVLLALRDLRLRYRQTLFGVGWALLRPLAAALIFTLVLGHAVGLSSDGMPYGLFVLSGYVFWQLCAAGIESAATSLVDERELVTRVWFPRLLAPIGAVVPGVLDLAVSLGAVAVVMAIDGVAPGIGLVTIPLCVLAGMLLALGAGALLCAVNVQFRDVKHALGFFMQLWFFATPIVFASSVLDGIDRWVLAINPLCGLVDCWRWALVDAPAPPVEDLLSLATGVTLVVFGLLYFRVFEPRFADVI